MAHLSVRGGPFGLGACSGAKSGRLESLMPSMAAALVLCELFWAARVSLRGAGCKGSPGPASTPDPAPQRASEHPEQLHGSESTQNDRQVGLVEANNTRQ